MGDARPVTEWQQLFDDETGRVYDRLRDIYGDDPEEVRRRAALWREALAAFAREFSPDAPVFITRACGRVNLLGMHIDHRGGAVNPLAVGDTLFVVEPRDDDRVVLRNVDAAYPPRSFSIRDELPPEKIDDWDDWTMDRYQERAAAGTQADWSNYVRAGVLYLQHLHRRDDGSFDPALRGMNVLVAGNVRPASGLSSSSSVVVAAMEACLHVNGLEMPDLELAAAGQYAEWYVGTRGGGGDHAAIKFCKSGHLAHIGSFPVTVELIPLPEDYVAVLLDSAVSAAKTAEARNVFNQRVAGYELGLLLLKKSFPEHADKMEHLRDVNPETLGVDEGEIYQVLKALPEVAHRADLDRVLADRPDERRRIYRSHDPLPDGYHIRQVCLYGIAECLRSEHAVELLRAGDVAGFGELITLSHDGDRVTELVDGRRVPVEKPLPDEELDRLTADVRGDAPGRRAPARLYRQPGGYDASCEELDTMVDIALGVEGVLGAGLVGAGLGGSIVALVEREQVDRLVAAVEAGYWRPRGLPTGAQVCPGVGGSGILDVPCESDGA